MSDPVANLDLEDVLSSIRRLVSDTAPPADRPAADSADRFVLTPALRVVPPDTPAEAPAPEPDSVARMAARIEAAVAAEAADFEPDGTEEPAPIAWADAPAAEAPVFRRRDPAVRPDTADEDVAFHHRRPAPAPTDAAETPVLTDDMDPLTADADLSEAARELLVDEETLRAIVADVVRQELQGALGERITRNVRKLVRREIYRVLAEQDLA